MGLLFDEIRLFFLGSLTLDARLRFLGHISQLALLHLLCADTRKSLDLRVRLLEFLEQFLFLRNELETLQRIVRFRCFALLKHTSVSRSTACTGERWWFTLVYQFPVSIVFFPS